MNELTPTRKHLKDPYVLQLIEGLSMQQDEIEDRDNMLWAWLECHLRGESPDQELVEETRKAIDSVQPEQANK